MIWMVICLSDVVENQHSVHMHPMPISSQKSSQIRQITICIVLKILDFSLCYSCKIRLVQASPGKYVCKRRVIQIDPTGKQYLNRQSSAAGAAGQQTTREGGEISIGSKASFF